MQTVHNYRIYTDGACRGNPGPGGWGALIFFQEQQQELKGSSPQTTNNRMELTAAIEGLAYLPPDSTVHLTTDSQYVRNGITLWVAKWQQKGWRTANNQAVKNRDLWEALVRETKRHQVTWHWIKGHSGHPQNERADALANEAIDEFLQQQANS